MQSALFLLVCFVLALAGLRRPLVPLVAGLALYIFVPIAASQSVVGVALGQLALVHPATYLFAINVVVLALLDTRRAMRALTGTPMINIAVILFLLVAFLTTYFEVGFDGLSVLINQVAGPFAAFLAIRAITAVEAQKLANWFVRFMVVEVIVVVAVYAGALTQPFDAVLRSTYNWYALSLDPTRAVGTTDHPLVLGMFFVVAIPLVAQYKRAITQVLLVGLFVVGIVLSQSRTSLALSAVALAVLIFTSSLAPRVRTTIAVGALVIAGALGASSLSSGITERLENDGGSASGRVQAWSNGLPLWPSHLILGDGSGASSQAAVAAGLGTSFESPLLMYSIDYGVIATLLLFLSMLSVVLRRKSRWAVAGAATSALLAIISVHAFSSVATLNNTGGILFITLALASYSARKTKADDDSVPTQQDRQGAVPAGRDGRRKHTTVVAR